jgi:hypothetical protein
MSRPKGSGKFGSVRSLRLPVELDRWFEVRLREEAQRPASDILLEAVHGGLRLQPGYMRRHRDALAALIAEEDAVRYESYVSALADSFGTAYVKHVEAWLAAGGFVRRTPCISADPPQTKPNAATMAKPSHPADGVPSERFDSSTIATSSATSTDADVTVKL